MPEYLQVTIDKFTFRVDPDCLYHPEGVWARVVGERVRVGLSDYRQQHSGDVAFVEVQPVGSALAFGDEFASIETIKVDVSVPSPAGGQIVSVNPQLEGAPEVINQDPYGEGWLGEIEPANWETERAKLLSAEAYFEKMKQEAEEEVGRK